MTTTQTTTAPVRDAKDLWHRVPGATKAAYVMGVVGFFVKMTSKMTESVNGVQTKCTYLDAAGLFWSIAISIAAVVGFLAAGSVHPARRLTLGVRAAVLAPALLLAVVHAARGLGLIMSPC